MWILLQVTRFLPICFSVFSSEFCALEKMGQKPFTVVVLQSFLKGLLRLIMMQYPSDSVLYDVCPPFPSQLLCFHNVWHLLSTSSPSHLSFHSLRFSWLTQASQGSSTVKHVQAHICTGSSLAEKSCWLVRAVPIFFPVTFTLQVLLF